MAQFFTDTHEAYPDRVNPDEPTFTGQIDRVSFSTLSKFEQCPYAVYLERIKGITSVGSKTTDRGSKLHKLLEDYVLGTADEVNWKLFKAHDYHAPIIESFRELHRSKPKALRVEYPLAFTKNMKPCKWDAKKAWLRAAIDVVKHNSDEDVVLYDYKTGSNQTAAKHRSQLMLYALLYMIRHPEVQTCDVAAIYLDLKIDNFYGSYTRNDIELYWPRYHQRLKQVTNCTNFKPNPNGYTCRYCSHKTIQSELNQIKPACEFAYIG